MKKPKKIKVKTTSKLKKELDAIHSRWVRLSRADDNGMCTCYTCDRKIHYKEIQCGHLVSRYYLATRYDNRNTRPQCIVCNMWRNGMIPTYSIRLEQELGEGITKTLYRDAQKIVKDYPYQAEIDRYKALVKELELN